ncbi:MAG TPA: alpha-amylase family glycosyl hydrolase [Chloroflexia bacterium]|jgi:alpha-glucosidase|nr:alpha-amylase family glycosyl hydrolase [Chloroflexia bacterium]
MSTNSQFEIPISKSRWWQSGIVYQIYPRSFKDSNGDGIGDLPGITEKLDYLRSLNIDAIWISPFYPSPMADFGYDISDYTDVHPMFGTLADADRLIAEAHSRDIRVILDFVPNHSSDRHPWFVESRASRGNPRRDWYMWADPAPGGGPPNNWLSVFGGSAWEYDHATGQYYYHQFLKEQPDLNWRNPDVVEAMHAAMRFWLDRGVDGFRLDAVWFLFEDPELRDEPPNPEYTPDLPPYESLLHVHTEDLPEMHDAMRAMRRVVDEHPDRLLIGEIYLPLPRLMPYYGAALDECHLPYNFSLISWAKEWRADVVRRLVEEYEAALPAGAWPNWVLGNHDNHRIASRAGARQARVAQMLLLTLRGTPTCYYGDELGMADVEVPPEKVQDPWGQNVPGQGLGRDPERTPMQWDPGPHAGFSTVEPWLPIAPDYRTLNVEVAQQDPRSILSMFRALTALRRETPALSLGSYRSIESGNLDVYAFLRELDGDRILVALNFGPEDLTLNLSTYYPSSQVLISTEMDRNEEVGLGALRLRGNEGIVVRLTG